MSETNLEFSQLSDYAATIAVTDFGRFYLIHFRTDGLEVFAQLDRSGYVSDINQYLMENVALHSDELLESLIRDRRDNVAGFLNQLDFSYDEDGKSQPALEQWYFNQKNSIEG